MPNFHFFSNVFFVKYAISHLKNLKKSFCQSCVCLLFFINMNFKISAPGKVILHGEYAAVFQKAAVAVSIDLRTTLTYSSHENKLRLSFKKFNFSTEWSSSLITDLSYFNTNNEITPINEDIIKRIFDVFVLTDKNYPKDQENAILVFLYLYVFIHQTYKKGSFLPCVVDVDTQLSIGSGTGSSASFSVCVSAAFLFSCGAICSNFDEKDKKLINKWAYEAEKIFHGKPSGIDNSVCTFGGALLFEKGVVIEIMPELPNLKILLIDTKVSKNTKTLVEKVKSKHELFSSVIDSIMEAIGAISKESWERLKNRKIFSAIYFQEMITMNHFLLETLDVSHPKLDIIHSIAKKHNLGSKLTGSGGGGCAIILLSRKGEPYDPLLRDTVIQELKSCDFDLHELRLGSPGVTIECLEN